MSEFPSQTQDKFVLRLPDGMRARIKAAAAENGRSMNAEIVGTLLEAYPPVNDYVEQVKLAALATMKILEAKGLDPDSDKYADVVGQVVAEVLKDIDIPEIKFRDRDSYEDD